MALPESAYRDPADLCDTLRRIERKMRGCRQCEHDDRVFGIKVCLRSVKPDEDGYCAAWTERAG